MNAQFDVIDVSGSGHHGIARNPQFVWKGQPPIIGSQPSYRLQDSGYLEMGTLGDFASEMGNGFSIGIDLQSERSEEQIICGTGVMGKTGLVVCLNASGVLGRLELEVKDDNDKSLKGYIQLSRAAGKRLIITVDPPNNTIKANEIAIHCDASLSTEYISQQSPTQFSNFEYPFLISGCNLNGCRWGSFVGRISQVLLLGECLPDDAVDELMKASRTEIEQTYGMRPKIAYNAERREIFIDDLAKLKQWNAQPALSRSETRDASKVISMWLFDRHPLLQDLCDELGLQLSMPGASDGDKSFTREILKYKPGFYQIGTHGVGGPLGYKWVPLSQFREQIAFHIEGHTVSHEGFVKLVRHKLGGVHFDMVDRKKWQRDLKAYSDTIRLFGNTAIDFQMKSLVSVIVQAVESCGIEPQLALIY